MRSPEKPFIRDAGYQTIRTLFQEFLPVFSLAYSCPYELLLALSPNALGGFYFLFFSPDLKRMVFCAEVKIIHEQLEIIFDFSVCCPQLQRGKI